MCVLGTFWKSQKVIILSKKQSFLIAKIGSRKTQILANPQTYHSHKNFVLLIQFQWNCPGDEIHVRKEEI